MTEEGDDRPRDLDAERAVLGACMLNADAVAHAQNHITAEDFYRPAHATLFRVLVELFEAGQPTDPVSVAALLEQRGHLLRAGGAPALHSIYADTPTASNVTYWAEIVADRAARARIIDGATHIAQAARGDADDTAALQERAREIIEQATENRAALAEDDGAWVGDIVDEHIEAWDADDEPTLPAPFYDLNDVLNGGLRAGQLVVIAGRPGMGKSVLGTDWALTAADHGQAALIMSLEMPRRDVVNRLIAARAKVRLADISGRSLNDGDRYRVEQARKELHDLPIRIEDRFAMSLARLRAIARECRRGPRGLGLLVVDYLQLLTPADPRLQRREQVDAFSRGLKSLAGELDIPVIAIAQLNRGPEQRNDKRPLMSDLRESGSLEQDADLVILIHRPDAAERDDPRAGEADLILAKHRNGPTAVITIAHQLHYARFRDIARG